MLGLGIPVFGSNDVGNMVGEEPEEAHECSLIVSDLVHRVVEDFRTLYNLRRYKAAGTIHETDLIAGCLRR